MAEAREGHHRQWAGRPILIQNVEWGFFVGCNENREILGYRTLNLPACTWKVVEREGHVTLEHQNTKHFLCGPAEGRCTAQPHTREWEDWEFKHVHEERKMFGLQNLGHGDDNHCLMATPQGEIVISHNLDAWEWWRIHDVAAAVASNEEQKESGDVWSQPLPDARASTCLNAPKEYNEDLAKEDAEKLLKAMKGMGTDEKTVIDIAGKRTYEQRQMIRAAFPEVSEGKDLIDYIEGDFKGKLEDFLVGLFQTQGEFDAAQIVKACKGMGTDEDLVMEILCTRNWEQLNNIKGAWKEDKPFDEYIDSEVKGSFEKLLLNIINHERDANGTVNDDQAKLDAEEVHRLVYENKNEAKQRCINIFSQRSWRHIARMNEMFQGLSKEHTLETALKEKMDGDTARAMRVIIEFASQPYDFWAKKNFKNNERCRK